MCKSKIYCADGLLLQKDGENTRKAAYNTVFTGSITTLIFLI
jgi:hypothetical protein